MSEDQDTVETESRSQMYKHEDIYAWLIDEGAITEDSTGPQVIAAFAANRNRYRKTERYLTLVASHAETAEQEREEAKAAKEAAKAAAKAEKDAERETKAAEKAKAAEERQAAAAAKAAAKAEKDAKPEPAKAEKPAAKAAKKSGSAKAATEDNPFE